MGFIENLRSKYELYKLEQRYTRRDKRTTFCSGAQYVDGEYVYSPTGSSTKSYGSDGSFGGKTKRMSTIQVKEIFTGGGIGGGERAEKRRSRIF